MPVQRLAPLLLTLALIAVACGDDNTEATTATTTAPAATTTTAETTTTLPPTTTLAPTTRTLAPTTTTLAPTTTTLPPTTTTEAPAAAFTSADLPTAVLQDGDPWVVPVAGVVPIELTIDDIWPLEGERQFPDERAIYEEAGFEGGTFSGFADGSDGLVLAGAHLLADPDGAAAAFDVIRDSFSDLELIAIITGLQPGALTGFELIDSGDFGDQAVGVYFVGDTVQLIGVIWITGNLLQFVRAAMPLDDTDREAATFAVAQAMATRMGG